MIDREHGDKDEEASARWINSIDRGVLVHIHNRVHKLFLRMEQAVQETLRKDKASEPLPNHKEINVLKDSGVLSSWGDIGVEFEDLKAL